MKGNKYCFIAVFLVLALFVSCRSNGPEGVDITGLWSGTISSNDTTNDERTVVFEFQEDGTVYMGDPDYTVIYQETVSENFIWSLSDYYLKLTAWFDLYYSEFVYQVIDSETIELVLISRNFFNETFEEFNTGDRILLIKDSSGSSFSQLLDSTNSY